MNRAEKKAARLRWYKVLEEQLEARQAEEQRAAAARAEQEDEASELSSEPELSLGNVCSPEPLQMTGSKQGKAQDKAEPSAAAAVDQEDDPAADKRPLLLFDLNGVLVSEKAEGEWGRNRKWNPRPDISLLLLLLPRYRLGVFSSARAHNVKTALAHVHVAANRGRKALDAADWLPGADGAPGGPPRGKKSRVVPKGASRVEDLFSVVLSREHCRPDPTWESRPDGQPWDTIKPLAGSGLGPEVGSGRVLLVDNEARKAAPGEADCCLVLPTWERCKDLGAASFAGLVRALLALPEHEPAPAAGGSSGRAAQQPLDLRRHTARINALLASLAQLKEEGGGEGGDDGGEQEGGEDEEEQAWQEEHAGAGASGGAGGAAAGATPAAAPARGPAPAAVAPGATAEVEVEVEAGGAGPSSAAAAGGPAAKRRRVAGAADVGDAVRLEEQLGAGGQGNAGAVGHRAEEEDDKGEEEEGEEEGDAVMAEADGDGYLLPAEGSEGSEDEAAEAGDGEGEEAFGPLDGMVVGGPLGGVDGGAQGQGQEEEAALLRTLEAGLAGAAGRKRGRVVPGAQPLYNGPRGAGGGAAPSAAGQGRGGAAAAAAQQHPHQHGCYSALHGELLRFAAEATPSEADLRSLDSALRAVQVAARSLWPASRVVLFGSQAAGLSLPGSDLDVVILGVLEDCALPEDLGRQRELAGRCLAALGEALKRAGALAGNRFQLIKAKVPIIKANVRSGLGTGGQQEGGGATPQQEHNSGRQPWLAVDISMGTLNGAHAAAAMRRCVAALPPLRPLVLCLKAILREAGLNEVFTGGLSSYSVFSLVLAHLQCEGYAAASLAALREGGPSQGQGLGLGLGQASPAAGGGAGSSGSHSRQLPPLSALGPELTDFLRSLIASCAQQGHAAAGPSAAPSSSGAGAAGAAAAAPAGGGGSGAVDLGDMLLSLLFRYGHAMDWATEMVSVARGAGVLSKHAGWRGPPGLAPAAAPLAIEDPQAVGRDIAAGSCASPIVRVLLRAALAKLLLPYTGNSRAPGSGHRGPKDSSGSAYHDQQQQQQQEGDPLVVLPRMLASAVANSAQGTPGSPGSNSGRFRGSRGKGKAGDAARARASSVHPAPSIAALGKRLLQVVGPQLRARASLLQGYRTGLASAGAMKKTVRRVAASEVHPIMLWQGAACAASGQPPPPLPPATSSAASARAPALSDEARWAEVQADGASMTPVAATYRQQQQQLEQASLEGWARLLSGLFSLSLALRRTGEAKATGQAQQLEQRAGKAKSKKKKGGQQASIPSGNRKRLERQALGLKKSKKKGPAEPNKAAGTPLSSRGGLKKVRGGKGQKQALQEGKAKTGSKGSGRASPKEAAGKGRGSGGKGKGGKGRGGWIPA